MLAPLLALLPLATEILVSASVPALAPRWLGLTLMSRTVPLGGEARERLRLERPIVNAVVDYRQSAPAASSLRGGTLVERLGLRGLVHLSVGEASIDVRGGIVVRLTADRHPLSFLVGGTALVSLAEEDACLRLEGRWLPMPFLSFLAWAVLSVLLLGTKAGVPLLVLTCGAASVYARSSDRMRRGLQELEELVGRRVTTLLAP